MPLYVDEVVLVDGRSTDNTVGVARALRSDIVVVNELRKGKGVALRSGFAAATGDIIVMLDADGSADPGEIPLYVAAALLGALVGTALGVKRLPSGGILKALGVVLVIAGLKLILT